MTAEEARQRALVANTSIDARQYTDILNHIARMASKGQYDTWWYEKINDYVRHKLTEQGYSVGETKPDRNNGVMIKIEWR